MLLSTAVYVSAEDKHVSSEFSYMPEVGKDYKSLINNKYYKIYYNDLLEIGYSSLNGYNLDGMTENTLARLEEGTYLYATVILEDKTEDIGYNEYNTTVLSPFFSDEDMLYVGDTTPLTIVKLTMDDAEKLLAEQKVIGIFPAFFGTNIIINYIVGERTMGNVTGTGGTKEVTAADARKLLRYSAGLEEIARSSAKVFYFCGDMDFDGEITSADARLALRTAAGLEEEVKITFGSASKWYDFKD